MTADEIKRALKTCSVPSACVGCVYKDADECIRALIADALDLIDDQDERISIMQESMETLEKRCNALEALEQRCNALEALKEQEVVTIKKIKEHVFGVYGGICPKCHNWIQSAHSFCGFCGQAVKWE